MSKKSIHLKNLAKQTQSSYTSAIHAYEDFHQLSFQELIDEAILEQENQVPYSQLKLYDRLLDFRNYLTGKYQGTTVRTYMTIISTQYLHNRVELPKLPRLNSKQLIKNDEIELTDLLTKDEIKKAMQYMELRMRTRTMCMAQAGLSNAECNVLLTRDFIDDLYPYHQCKNDKQALEYLANKEHTHLWVTKLTREKTKKPYYAVFSPECVQMIALTKLKEKKLKPKLLTNNDKSYYNALARINDEHGFGYAGGHRRLRPHMLRKFHATSISSSVLDYTEDSMLRNFEIDELQGRGKTRVQDTYIKTNPVRQKLLYAKVMNKVTFFNEYDYEFVDGDVHVWVKDHKRINQKLQDENKYMKKQVEKNNKLSDGLRNYIEDVGYDNFKSQLSELLHEL